MCLSQNSSDIPRCVQNLHDRLWLAGAGWHFVGKAGQLLERSPVDRSVSAPERLVFEGAPVLEHPLAQHEEMRRPVPHEGVPLDSRLALPPLDAGEQARLDQLRNESARALGKEADTVRRRYVEEHAAKIAAKHNMSLKTARRLVSGVHHHVLSPYHELEFDDLGTITAGAVLDDPESFVGLTLADPIEGIAYGRCKAKIMRGDDGLLFIHSFAHGRTIYRLCYDLRQAEAALERAQNMDDVAEIVAASQLEADEREHFIKSVAKKTGLKQPAIKKRLKDDAERRQRARRPAESVGSADRRAQRQCPPPRGALSEVVADLDGVLASDLSRSPPMRDVDGRLVEVRVAPPEGLHMIAGESGPAAEPTIHKLSAIGIQMQIERHACFLATSKEGPYEAALPLPFIDGLNDYQNTKLPIIRAINTAPVVADDGTLVDGDGLDRKTGLFHCIDPDLRKCLPQTTPTDDEVKEAMRFLCDEWLVDVATDLQGKFATILLVLTLIQRALLDARPAFFISAGIAKAGKTTLAQMCSTAVFGHSASGANWSDEVEERRKALFSFLRQGVRLVLWDNIRRGAEISCPHIERSLTENRMIDRVLGYTRAEAVPTNTIQVFTGNRIKPKGDMCSRSFTITLDAGRPDPEARPFAHPDPLQWTRANRLRIIKACYTILIAGVRCRPPDVAAKTRFKTWWKLVGWPVEHAASLYGHAFDCTALTLAEEAEDAEATATAELISILLKIWPDRQPFLARDVVQQMPREGDYLGTSPPDRPHAFELAEALSEIVGKPLVRPTAKSITSLLKKHVVDRSVWMPDGTHAVMRKHPDHEANSYWIEVSGTPGGHGDPDRSAPTRKPWRRPVFDPATLKKLAKAIGSSVNDPDVVAEDDES